MWNQFNAAGCGKALGLCMAACIALHAGAAQAHDDGCTGPNPIDDCTPRHFDVPYTTSTGVNVSTRMDYFLPTTPRPAAGYPVVMMFHGGGGVGSLYEAQNDGGYGARTIQGLLLAGYAVLVPRAPLWNWHTNWPEVVAGTDYELIRDYRFLDKVIRGIRDPWVFTESSAGLLRLLLSQLDPDNLFASGISDGGAQASRMARSWLDENDKSIFKAIVLNAGSWNTCAADAGVTLCMLPDIDFQHAPVLFLHAEADPVVGVNNADVYAEALEEARTRFWNPTTVEWRAVIAREANGTTPMDRRNYASCTDLNDRFCVSYDAAIVPSGGHRFLAEAPLHHLVWFNHYRDQ